MADSALDLNQEQRLQATRAQYLSSLSARLTALHEALNTVSAGGLGETHAALLRRLRAMADAAAVLGYEEMAHAFRAAFELLGVGADGSVSPRALHEARSLLDLVPSLVPDAPEEAAGSEQIDELKECGPLTVVCMLSAGQHVLLRRALRQATGIRIVATTALPELQTFATTYEPDWIVIDGRRADALEAVARLRLRPCLVLDAPEHVAGRLKAAGARHVAREGVSLRTTLLENFRAPRARASETVPKSDVSTIGRVVESAAQDMRESLLVGLSPHETQQLLTPAVQSALEALTWSAISKMREVISEASGGAIQYPELAPEGALLVTGKAALRHSRHPAADGANLKGRRVLVADDDSAVTWFLSSILRAAGADVVEARDGFEALRLARETLPDLVISDVMMPELDGFALCRNLKRDVLLSDVPVILLSWKEDLLQRVRELGVGAAGYLPKETEATVIVERCCEAIEPRVRIERRLRDKEVVHGRLDGVTPRLVLELAAAALENACVTFTDAAFTYQVYIGDGRVVAAARSGRDQVEERGDAILPGLLGMRAGRFTVEPTRQAVKTELFGSLTKLLAPHVERARRATAQLSGTRIYDVQRLDVDYGAIAPYLASSPAITTKLVERLAQGITPSSLLQQVSAGLLESVLQDLAQRGAVQGAWGADGQDLLAGEAEGIEAFDVDLGPPRPGAVVEPARGATKVNAQSTAQDVERATAFAERAVVAAQQRKLAPIAQPDVGEQSVPAAAVTFEPAKAVEFGPTLIDQGDGSDALLGEDDIVTPPFLRARVEAALEPGRALETGLIAKRQQQRATLTGLGFPSPPRNVDWQGFTAPETRSISDFPGDALDSLFADSSPAPAVSELVPQARESAQSVRPAVVEAREPSLSARPPALELRDASVAQQVGPLALVQPLVKSERTSASATNRGASLQSEALDLGDALLGGTPAPASAEVQAHNGDAASNALLVNGAPSQEDESADSRPTTPPSLLEAVTQARPRRATFAQWRQQRLGRALVSAAVLFGTAGTVFGLSSGLWRVLGLSNLEQQKLNAGNGVSIMQQAAPLSPVASERSGNEATLEDDDLAGAGRRAALAELRSSLMDLPSDIQVANDSGLLEINSDGRHKIYVNDVFLGRGPVRRVPLKPGAYTLVLRLDGAEQAFPFEVVLGRRTRVEPVGSLADDTAASNASAAR